MLKGRQAFQNSKRSLIYICHKHHTYMYVLRDTPLFVREGLLFGGQTFFGNLRGGAVFCISQQVDPSDGVKHMSWGLYGEMLWYS